MNSKRTDAQTQAFYSAHRWPGPKAIVSRKWAVRIAPYITGDNFVFLDAGCGSGQYTIGMLSQFPLARGVAIDVSERSLQDLQYLAQKGGFEDRLEIKSQSFSEPLGWEERFDVVIANGSIHHSPNPSLSMSNLARTIKVNGVLGCMIYGARSHSRRYELKELLHLLADEEIDAMYRLYQTYQNKFGLWIDRTPRAMVMDARRWMGRRFARVMGKEENLGYDPRSDRKQNFIDAYAAPIDVAFTSLELRDILTAAGLELCEMLTMGRPDPSLLPEGWREPWDKLGQWDKIRVCELLTPDPVSFSFVARRQT